jgi:hypothetical protein
LAAHYVVTSSIVRLISRANLLLERAKADVRKTPRPALRVGRAAVAQAISGSGAALARAGGTPSFWWPSLRRQSELDQAPDCLGPGRGRAGRSGCRRQWATIRSSARKLRRSD